MPFPKSLLSDHEELILDLRPHWVALVFPIIVAVGVTVGLILLWSWTGSDGVGSVLRYAGLGIGLVIVLWFSVKRIINWATDNFVVTTDRVIRRRGLFAKNSFEIPLEAINDVRFEQSIIGRMIGAGTLVIQSASENGREEFANIRHPEQVQKTIYEMGEQNQRRMYGGGSGGGTAGTGSVAEEIRKLDRLRDDGVLTEEEFAAQKKKLLDGGTAQPSA